MCRASAGTRAAATAWISARSLEVAVAAQAPPTSAGGAHDDAEPLVAAQGEDRTGERPRRHDCRPHPCPRREHLVGEAGGGERDAGRGRERPRRTAPRRSPWGRRSDGRRRSGWWSRTVLPHHSVLSTRAAGSASSGPAAAGGDELREDAPRRSARAPPRPPGRLGEKGSDTLPIDRPPHLAPDDDPEHARRAAPRTAVRASTSTTTTDRTWRAVMPSTRSTARSRRRCRTVVAVAKLMAAAARPARKTAR